MLAGTVLAFGAGWGWAGLLNYSIVRSYPHAPAAATGMTQGAAYLGGVVGPTAFGLAGTHLSLAVAWWGAGIAVLIAALCTLLGRSLMAARER